MRIQKKYLITVKNRNEIDSLLNNNKLKLVTSFSPIEMDNGNFVFCVETEELTAFYLSQSIDLEPIDTLRPIC